MSVPPLLHAERRRDTGTATVRVRLLDSLAPDRRRAVITPAEAVRPGDRLHFAEPAAGNVCLLGRLEATVAALDDATAVLVFPFAEPVLSELIDLLTPSAGSDTP